MILNGWKEIAAYVNSSIRTVQRWEKIGMPVVRPVPSSRGSVIAYSEQLDSWLGRSQDRRQLVDAGGKNNDTGLNVNFYDRLMEARSLTQQLMKTKAEMAECVRMLRAQTALLRQNMVRMQFARNQYADAQSMQPLAAAAELNVAKLARGGRLG
jgi:phage terminase Nu1 subunit (DNA packaging protein)